MRPGPAPPAARAVLTGENGSGHRRTACCAAALALLFLVGPRAAEPIPASLSDAAFWQLVGDLSEPDGYFDSDNLLTNETTAQHVIPRLVRTVKPGQAYLGVGPEQNFAYLIALRPSIAFVLDIRRGNLHEHLVYKALIEMAADRADFVSLLFARPRPAGLGAGTTVGALLDAYGSVRSDAALYRRTLAAIRTRLAITHGFALRSGDVEGIGYVYSSFYEAGPSLSYTSSRPQRIPYPTYDQLQRETDGEGVARGYLASEANFQALKAFETRNLVVPLVGDFAGAKTLRSVGAYLKAHSATVGAFYTSNVENYLFQNGIWDRFAANVAALPLDESSTFIRACFDRCVAPAGSRTAILLDPMAALLRDVAAGKVRSYSDVLAHR